MPNIVDFDIHGIVGLRLIDCPAATLTAAARRFGRLQRRLSRNPDIVVKFVPRMDEPGMQYMGLNQYGFTERDFFLIDKKTCARAKIPFEQVGGRCEILVEHGMPLLPFLVHLVNLTALKKEYVAVHASAFLYRNTAIVVSGWKKGGKTECLLAFAAQGARYIGDEWILLRGDGRLMYGLPGVVPLWDWHLSYFPQLRQHVNLGDRLFFRTVRLLDALQKKIPQGKLDHVAPVRFLRDAMPPLKRHLSVPIEPGNIFTDHRDLFRARPDKIFLAISQQSPQIDVAPADPMDVAGRMLASVRYEQSSFFKDFLAFKFAFPDRKNHFLDGALELQRDMLRRALLGKQAFFVSHPYPVSIPALFDSMRPLCDPQQQARNQMAQTDRMQRVQLPVA